MAQKKDEKKRTWYYYGSYRDSFGKIHQYKKRGYATRRDARIAEEEFRREVQKPKTKITFGELMEHRINDSEVKESTMEGRQSAYKHFDRFSDVLLTDITKEMCKSFLKEIDDKYSNGYYNFFYSQLNNIFNYAVDDGYIEVSPMQGIKKPKRQSQERKEMKFWEPSDFEKFIQYVDVEDYQTFFIVLYYMGTRKGEALGLLWSDIDFTNKTIDINKTFSKKRMTSPKTLNSYRIITMPDIVCDRLKAMKNRRENEYGYHAGERVFRNVPYYSIREYMLKCIGEANKNGANLDIIRIHDFRHSHASYLINNMSAGFTDFDIAKRLGDTVSTLHATYAHWFKQKDESIINFMNMDTKKGLSI